MLLVAFLVIACSADAQTPGAVQGVVRNSVTGAPVRKALVVMRSVYRHEGYTALSDATGRFHIDNVKPGEYGLVAEAQGYVRRLLIDFEPSQIVKVTEGSTIQDFEIRVEPLSVISGRVLNERGEPLSDARVEYLRYTYSRGGVAVSTGGFAVTNDRGEYRLFDIAAGRWYLRVSKSIPYPTATGRVHREVADSEYGYTYYPDVTREQEAIGLELSPGMETGQIDIRIRRSRVFRIRGKVVDGRTGQLVPNADVEIQGQGHVASHADGLFDARGMPPGVYHVAASWKQGDASFFAAAQEAVITDHDADGLVLRLELPLQVTGTAVVEQGTPDAMKNLRVMLEPVSGMMSTQIGVVQEDGGFRIPNIAAGQEYRVWMERQPKGTYLKSARVGTQDATAEAHVEMAPGAPLALVFGADGGRVRGAVQGAQPGSGSLMVTLAPSGGLSGRMDLVQTVDTESGAFTIEGVPPGEYKLFAWELEDEAIAGFPEFRALLEASAQRLTVRSGETQSASPTKITAAEVREAIRKLR